MYKLINFLQLSWSPCFKVIVDAQDRFLLYFNKIRVITTMFSVTNEGEKTRSHSSTPPRGRR